MEEMHVDKDGGTTKPDLASHQLQQWVSEAKDESTTDVSGCEITYTEVKRTFHQCSNTTGPDGVKAQMIDSANREQMTECLSAVECSLDVKCHHQDMETGAHDTSA